MKIHYPYLDIGKFIMSFFVISIHTLTFNTSNAAGKALWYLVNCAVPFYFIVSGFLVLQGVNIASKENVETQILKSIKRTAKLYFTWTIIYLPISIYFSNFNTAPLKSTLILIQGIFFVGENAFSWPLWYLLSTLYSLLFVYVAIRFLKWKKPAIYTSACISLILVQLLNTFSSAEISNSMLQVFQKLLHVSIANGRIFTGIFYIILGFMIAEYQPKIQSSLCKGRKILFIFVGMVSGILYVVSNFKYRIFSLPITVVPIVIICLKPYATNNTILKKVRKCSTIIYLTHMIWFVLYSGLILKDVGCHCIESFLATSFFSLVGAILVLTFDYKGKISRLLL